MALTMEQALHASEFHAPDTLHPCGGTRSNTWRRNGATKTWKRRPTAFRIPVKFGLYAYGYIEDTDTFVHVSADCPARPARVTVLQEA